MAQTGPSSHPVSVQGQPSTLGSSGGEARRDETVQHRLRFSGGKVVDQVASGSGNEQRTTSTTSRLQCPTPVVLLVSLGLEFFSRIVGTRFLG